MNIFPMTEQTVSQVAALEHSAFTTPWSEKSIREELKNPWAMWYVAMDKNRFCGYIGVQFGLDGGDIMTIATMPELRGQGIAKQLIQYVIEILREKQLTYLTLEVRPSNISALELYKGLGFQEVGRRKNYYKHPTEDALLYTLYFRRELYADNGN